MGAALETPPEIAVADTAPVSMAAFLWPEGAPFAGSEADIRPERGRSPRDYCRVSSSRRPRRSRAMAP